MNNANALIFDTLMNSPSLQTQFFRGLHRLARIALGYKPRGSLDVIVNIHWCGAMSYAYQVNKGMGIDFNEAFWHAIDQQMTRDGIDSDEIALAHAQMTTELYQAIFEVYWRDMLAYAKHNSGYDNNWQTPPAKQA
jgi:hypothetical protein